jgi:hypothetical protein
VVINDDNADLDGREQFHFGDGSNRDAMALALTAACSEPAAPPAGGAGPDAGGKGDGGGRSHNGGDRGAKAG